MEAQNNDKGHCRPQFETNFLVWKLLCLVLNFIDICLEGSNWQYSIIGSDNAPNRRQTIICSYVGLVYWRINASPGIDVIVIHDDVIKWKHFPRNWPFVRGIHRSPVNSPHKGQWCGALMSTLICARISGWVNTREAGDLRRYRPHCDVIVMKNKHMDKIADDLQVGNNVFKR